MKLSAMLHNKTPEEQLQVEKTQTQRQSLLLAK